MTNTSIQDRTPEFFSILAQAKKRQNAAKGPRNSLLSEAQKKEANGSATGERRARSEFARNAAQIGRGISATMGKLERLAQCTHILSRCCDSESPLSSDLVSSGQAQDSV